MNKYLTLVNILDELRKEAPIEYKKYYPLEDDLTGVNNARSKAFIHLFLKVKFGLLEFLDRESYITDGVNDGGVDGYFIDEENKRIYFIQSKFRDNGKNFENVNIELEDLLKMDLDRITKGEYADQKGVDYNEKIKKLIHKLQSISDMPKWKETVIILANVKDKYKDRISSLTIFPAEIFNYERVYDDLVFPVVSGTFYNPSELKITININSKSAGNRIDYYVDTAIRECNINVLFVPTIEIAKILYRYKNSILKFNPRSYLDLAKSSVNRKIQNSILELNTNEFALYNNGITMLSDNTYYGDRVAKKNEAALIVTNPQIINGGQTAFTLSKIFEEKLHNKESLEIFNNKEVLLKVITFSDENDDTISEEKKLELIESISKATNDQTEVTEADRRSNEKIQIQLQKELFTTFGYFYERKRGEFGDGLKNKYIDRSKIIDREIFLRICLSVRNNASQARRASSKQLFKKESINSALPSKEDIKRYFFGYKSFEHLGEIQKRYEKDVNNRFGQAQFGYGLRYGKIAITGIVSRFHNPNHEFDQFDSDVKSTTEAVLNKWNGFEEFVKKQDENFLYFRKYRDQDSGQEIVEVNFDNYYKGKTLSKDLTSFFSAPKAQRGLFDI